MATAMPSSTLPRHNRPFSPPASSDITTPARSKHVYPMSTTQTSTSYSPTVVNGGSQQKLNVVTRLAVEGRAKQGQDGASIRMYLKLSIPLDAMVVGTTIPLFQEESVKILTSQVHPLDNNSVPYNFSSTISPLLHNAARALNLPGRSSETFDSAFGLSPSLISNGSALSGRGVTKSAASSPPLSSESIAPVDGQYTGHILVSGYNISYVPPKGYFSQTRNVQSETEGEACSRSIYKSRKASIGERHTVQFMAAIDMWIPYVSRPPHFPYLLSIPTPRCLHNNIKLRIFPPTTTSASLASLSSIDDDGGTWDLTSDPHVTRSTSRTRRSNSYTHFADDESSDSSTHGLSGGCGIQGTFPSAERIRVRWAKPLKNIDILGSTGDGRRRVSVQEVKGEMSCIVRGKAPTPDGNGNEGLIMDLEYKGTCKGVWFAGVATMLGMDVSLEAKGSDVYWAEGAPTEWQVEGGKGYTGFEVGSSRQSGLKRTTSLDSDPPEVRISPPPGDAVSQATRTNSISSTSSLLRAPLPEKVAEYSFEGSAANLADSPTSPTETMSSMSIPSLSVDPTINPPGVPMTLHLNMNELVPQAKNTFTFTISGTVLVVARPISRFNKQCSDSSSESDLDPDPIVLPRFTVLAASSESTITVARHDIHAPNCNLEVYNATGDIRRDPQARKTVLQRGGYTKCTEDGARIALLSIGLANGMPRSPQHLKRVRTPNGRTIPNISSPYLPSNKPLTSYSKRQGPLIIPSVIATVLPLLRKPGSLAHAHTVHLCFSAVDPKSEWLEFGLACPDAEERISQKVTVTSASVGGVPVKYETTSASSRLERSGPTSSFEKITGQEWVSWVRVNVGLDGGAAIVLDYLVEEIEGGKGKGKGTSTSLSRILLPTFPIPIGKFEVKVDRPAGTTVCSVQSNFAYEQSTSTGSKYLLLNFSMAEFFYPQLSVAIGDASATRNRSSAAAALSIILFACLLCLAGVVSLYRLGKLMEQVQQAMGDNSVPAGFGVELPPATVTITTTLYRGGNPETWRSDYESSIGTASVAPEQFAPFWAASLTTSSSITPIRSDLPQPETSSSDLSPSSTATETLSLTTPSNFMTDSLLPVQNIITLYWPIDDWHTTFEKVAEAAHVVWQILRKLYHYPLDPP